MTWLMRLSGLICVTVSGPRPYGRPSGHVAPYSTEASCYAVSPLKGQGDMGYGATAAATCPWLRWRRQPACTLPLHRLGLLTPHAALLCRCLSH